MVIDRTLVNQICPAAADAGWPHPELQSITRASESNRSAAHAIDIMMYTRALRGYFMPLGVWQLTEYVYAPVHCWVGQRAE